MTINKIKLRGQFVIIPTIIVSHYSSGAITIDFEWLKLGIDIRIGTLDTMDWANTEERRWR